MFPSAYVSVRQRLCPPVSLPVCVYVRLYPCLSASLPVYVSVRLYPCQSASLPVSTLSTVAHQALFHRSLSNLSGFFCSSRLSCSFLFSLILSFHSSSSSFSFSFSLIFSLPILLTLLALPAIHPFELKTLYREQISGHWAAFPSATHLFLSKNLYREHTLRNCDVPLAATHPFELKTLYREQIPGH